MKKVKHKQLDVVRALKIVKKSKYKGQHEIKTLKSEIQLMKCVDHPSIAKLYEFFEDEESFYIITELCNGGPLFEEITKREKFSENEAAHIMM